MNNLAIKEINFDDVLFVPKVEEYHCLYMLFFTIAYMLHVIEYAQEYGYVSFFLLFFFPFSPTNFITQFLVFTRYRRRV